MQSSIGVMSDMVHLARFDPYAGSQFSGLSGVMTQCLRLDKFMAANNQYWNNVALK